MNMYLPRVAAKLFRRIRMPSQSVSSSCKIISHGSPNSVSSKIKYLHKYSFGGSSWRMNNRDPHLWTIIAAQAAIILGMNANPILADPSIDSGSENDLEGANITGLRKIEDGSVISNEHTSKWRIFTDNGREFFLQGKLNEAEKFFLSAIQEAKDGFGERDPHVASACNNLAELHRIKKEFDKAEPLYLEAVNILEEAFGPEDIRVGVALHNLGQFHLMQRKLEEARRCYERALKIKGRVLGYAHLDYADTMYHLGTVLYLLGKEKDGEALIHDSIRILEESGQGESITCSRQLRYLSKIYLKSNRLAEAENLQRKILHIMELSKGWNSMETVISAEGLALTLQAVGNLNEAQELQERCLDARKSLLPKDHIQIGANMLRIARVAMLKSNGLRKKNITEAVSELDKAKDLLYNSTRIAQEVLNKLRKQRGNKQNKLASEEIRKEGRAALALLLQSLDAIGLLESTKQELLESVEKHSSTVGAENALLQCISAYKEFETQRIISDSPEVRAHYLSCLKHLSSLISDSAIQEMGQSRRDMLPDLKDEIKRVELELSHIRKRKF